MCTPATKCLGELLDFLPHHRFTKVQEAVIPALFTNDLNCLVAAPTGSGKTMLLEVAMLRLFRSVLAPERGAHARVTHKDDETCNLARPLLQRKRKAVYICPIKALANEKYEQWRAQFPSLTVAIETGDKQQQQVNRQERLGPTTITGGDGRGSDALANMGCVSQADILVTTPERWDSITRRWKEKEVMAIVNSVGLLLLDEVHTVQEERGAAMEAIVSRVKIIQASSTSMHQRSAAEATVTRIIAISGTLPNSRDLAEWLQVSPEMTFTFAPSDRPVPLTIRVIGYAHDSPNPFAFHRFLSFKIFALMQQFSQGRPTLVFCASRKETASSAQRIVEDIREAATRQGRLAQLQPSAEAQQMAQLASDKQLRSCLMMGVGFHHAAMTMEDRQLVERMFREQYIAVICTTTTLALGVNLPAHLVLIKGTTFFSSGQCQDMPVSEVMQMCGRAGRPGFDTHGMALVLTMQRSVHLYETLASGAVALTCVESHLHRHMIEHVNAEVALRTIYSFPSAMEWVKTTLFWIRLRKCPAHYGLKFVNRAEELEFNAEAFVEALMERVLRVLMEEGCVRLSHTNALVLSSARETATSVAASDMEVVKDPSAVFEATRLGRAMSRMYILFDTVCTLNSKLRDRGAPSTNGDAPEEDSGPDACPGAVDVREKTTAQAVAMSVEEVPEHSSAKMHTSPEGMQPQSSATDAPTCSSKRQMMPFNLREVLQLLCNCQELVEVRLRQGDRGPLNELNKSVKYPLHSGRRGGREVREDWQKAFVLIQAHIELLSFAEVSLRNDSLRLWAVVPRVSRFLEEYAWAATTSYSLAVHANVLARCIERRVWPDGLVLRQLKHVSDSVAKTLLRSGYRAFESLGSVDARQLEVLCSRLPPFGSQVLSEVRRLPRISLDLSSTASAAEADGIHERHRIVSGVVKLTLSQYAEAAPDENVLDAERRQSSVAASSRTPHGQPQLLSGMAAPDSARVLLLVGIPSEDRVLLKRFVPLSTLVSPSAAQSTALAVAAPGCCPGTRCFSFVCPPSSRNTSRGGGRGRHIEARCLVLHVVGMDTVTVWDEVLASDRDGADGEGIQGVAQRPVLNASVPIPAPKGIALLPHRSAPQTELSVQVAIEARTTFNELLEDLKYVTGVGETMQPHRTGPRQPLASRKRTRSGNDACITAQDGQETPSKEGRDRHDIVAATLPLSATASATSVPSVPDVSKLRNADVNASTGAAAAKPSQERPAAAGSSLDSAHSSPEHRAGQAALLEVPLLDKSTPQHLRDFPSKSVMESPSLRMETTEDLVASTSSAVHQGPTRVRLQPCTSPPASRPPKTAGASLRACFPTLQREMPYPTPQVTPLMPKHSQSYCGIPPYVTASAEDLSPQPVSCTTPWSRQGLHSMVARTPLSSSRFVVRVASPHASFHPRRGDAHSSTDQRSNVLGQQEALYYPLDSRQAPSDMRYAVTGMQGEWWRPNCVQDPSWVHGAPAPSHQYPYSTPPMRTRLGHYESTQTQLNGVGYFPAQWEHAGAPPASRLGLQHLPSFFAPQPPIQFASEPQQMWQTRSQLPSYPPSQEPSVSQLHPPSPSDPYPPSKTPPWHRLPPSAVYAPLAWHPSAPIQPRPAPPSMRAPITQLHQPPHVAVMSSDLHATTSPSDRFVYRANASVGRLASVPTSGSGDFAPQVRRRSSMVVQSWWQ
ncbi:putative DEAD/DEAH box helicase-like protein [Leishmania braziliensis MHOM/BR/75/M2904]|uniref:DNA 3'-5' helicase n=2 Tax=Leishmania braziliensis TaxID=5660 RepID=A4HKC8_LEIBR|nr:putative DEAD/DEAH box helicase-like protein [Leishmania braziliensis MHOM/BR/75/M2904]KAI5687544.1 DEAD [Leishmania braziliensis]CAJ2478565.1 unnamed protein product [Leishmania braziliensis]CAM42951.2 putative DEAD/DEAH box helicase-like protein [Leishmania braziliensis MHOM/BR/75/M2904]SYZ68661.1 ATP-dependent_DNA_DEAD/DEAH_box_helicase [Leishmania braziliensis MHOM/BR/75/M2904]